MKPFGRDTRVQSLILILTCLLVVGGARFFFTLDADQRLVRTASALQAQMASYGEQARQAGQLLADNSQFVQWVALGDRPSLSQHLAALRLEKYRFLVLNQRGYPVFESNKSLLDQKTLHTLSRQPSDKLAMMRQGETIAILSVHPLVSGGFRRGTLITGVTLNERLTELKNLLGLDTALYLNGRCVGETFKAPQSVRMEKLRMGKPLPYRHYRAVYFPLLTYNGQSYGALMVAEDQRFRGLGLQLFLAVTLLFGIGAIALLFIKKPPQELTAVVPAALPDEAPRVPDEEDGKWELLRMSVGSMTKRISLSSTQLLISGQNTQRALETMTHSIFEIARGTSKQARALAEASPLAGAIADSVHRLSDWVGNALMGIQSVRRASKTGKETLLIAEGTLSDVQQAAHQASQSIVALETLGARILEMASLMEAYARKTNFLAINAGIEASRTDQTGVVVLSQDLKKLAEEAEEASRRITSSVRSAYQTIPAAATELTRVLEGVANARAQFRAASDASSTVIREAEPFEPLLRQIAAETISMVEQADQVALVLTELLATAHQNAGDSERLAQSIQHHGEGAQAIMGGAAHLSQLVEQLTQFVEQNDA